MTRTRMNLALMVGPLVICAIVHAGGANADDDPEAAAKALLRPVCAAQAARDRIVAKMIEEGGEYERATAKWDMDMACEQIDLSVTPLHDTADPAADASHSDWIYDAAWSPDGTRIVTAGRDKSVRIWDVATGKTVKRFDMASYNTAGPAGQPSIAEQLKTPSAPAPSDNISMARHARFLDGGRSIVVAADGHPVRVIDVETGASILDIPYASADKSWTMPPDIDVTPSGLVVIGGYKGEHVVYDTVSKSERYRLPALENDYPVFKAWEPSGLLVTTKPAGERSVSIEMRKLDSGALIWQAVAEGSRSADNLAFSRDGTQLVAAVQGVAYIYDVASGALRNKFTVYPTFGTFTVAFTADGKRLVAGVRHAQLWDIATGKRLHHFGPFGDLCHSVDVSPDGRYLVTSHIGSDARIWEIETGTFFRRLGKNVHPPG